VPAPRRHCAALARGLRTDAEFDAAVAGPAGLGGIAGDRLIGPHAGNRDPVRRQPFRNQVGLDRLRSGQRQADVGLPGPVGIGVANDLEPAVLESRHHRRHLVQQRQAGRPEHGAARLELHDAVGQGLVHHALILHGHTQAVAHGVSRVQCLRHVAGQLLPHGLVGDLTPDLDDLPLDRQLSMGHLSQVWREQLLHVVSPLRGGDHRPQAELSTTRLAP